MEAVICISIDLPPIDRSLQQQVGAAVGNRYADRWSYLKGSSRRHLPILLARLGQIDLFIHDSLHSERNVRFELDRAWAALKPGGVWWWMMSMPIGASSPSLRVFPDIAL